MIASCSLVPVFSRLSVGVSVNLTGQRAPPNEQTEDNERIRSAACYIDCGRVASAAASHPVHLHLCESLSDWRHPLGHVTRSNGSHMTCRSIGRHITYYPAALRCLLSILILLSIFSLPRKVFIFSFLIMFSRPRSLHSLSMLQFRYYFALKVLYRMLVLASLP